MRSLVLSIATSTLLSAPAVASADQVLLDATIAADGQLVIGTRASLYVAASQSRGLRHSEPTRATARARLVALDKEGKPGATLARLGERATDAAGRAIITFQVPAIKQAESQRHALVIEVTSPLGRRDKVLPVTVVEQTLLVARTDRGMYRPGSTLRWRVSALHRVDAHPVAGLDLDVEIRDPNNTAIWRGAVKTDAGGMVSGEIPLSDDIRRGRYQIAAAARDGRAGRHVEHFQVADVRLPAFVVSIDGVKADAAPGKPITARVRARYLHGEPVSGKVAILVGVDGMSLVKRETSLDRFGAATVSFTPPIGRRGRIRATVTDGAGRSHSSDADFTLPGASLNLAVIPERSTLSTGRQKVTVVTTNDRGELVAAKVRLWFDGATAKTTVDSPGAAVVELDIPRRVRWLNLRASAVSDDGRVAEASRSTSVTGDPRFVRVDRALIRPNEPVAIRGRWPDRQGPVFATLLRDGVPVTTAPVAVDRAGNLRATLAPPVGLFGLVTVRVVELPYDRRTGRVEPRVATRSVYVQPGDLDVSIRAKLRHRPGSRATVGVTVRDRDGRAVPGVHLAASVVDERILALSEPRPDLVEVLRELDTKSSDVESTGRRAGVAFASLLAKANEAPQRAALVALLDALPPEPTPPAHVLLTEAARVAAEHARMTRASSAVRAAMAASAVSFGARDKLGRWRFGRPLDGVLAAAGWKSEDRLTPWKRPTSWGYARELVPDLEFSGFASELVSARLDELGATLEKRRRFFQGQIKRGKTLADLAAAGRLPARLTIDPWGTPIALGLVNGSWTIRSAGPDQKLDTADDEGREGLWGTIGTGRYGTIGHGSGYGYGSGRGGLRGRSARAPQVRMGAASIDVKVRKRFDETVLWVTGVVTDGNGSATLEVDLADSITGWQIDVEAISKRGQVGAARGRLETFLPRYADPAVPSGLTTGDRYTVPVVVANHQAKAGRMRVEVAATGAITLRGGSSRADNVPANATRALGFPIQATRPGTGTLKVALFADGKAVDVIERTVDVLPPGRLIRSRSAATLGGGSGVLALSLPASIAAGTSAATVRVFRDAGDRALDGIDKLVSEPHGCFEQTSSATYPNLLVVQLLGKRADAPAAVSRARDYVARGYQRLISYEVSGGGFSWFGESPANQVLTAYGLMEFSDMASIYPVDTDLIARTRKWLLSKQRGDGSWAADKSWLHDWDAAQGRLATTAYVAWALAESGYRGKGLTRALRFLSGRRGQLARRPYLLALWAAAESLRSGKAGPATRALAAQLSHKGDGAFVSARGATLFYSRGRAADAQVTALAAMAFARAGMRERADKALSFVLGAGGSHGWGSTQGTVLALRAAAVMAPEPRPFSGKLRARINGRDAGVIDLAASGALGLALDRHLKPGANQVELRPEDAKASLPAKLGISIDSQWRTAGKGDAETQGIAVSLKPDKTSAARGERIQMRAGIKNVGKDAIAMPTVVIPVPPGFRFVPGSLRGASKVEDVGSEVRVYYKSLAAGAETALNYQLEAEAECQVTHRGVEAYAYYSPEIRGASAALTLSGTE